MIDYLNIGLDFGTHQSKVCIEDTADPRNRIYTFFKFRRPDGNKTFFLPSVVQVNKDHTLSYGFVDESQALVLGQKHSFNEPVLAKPPAPVLDVIKKKPVAIIPLNEDEFLARLSDSQRYRNEVFVKRGRSGRKKKKVVTIDVGREKYQEYLASVEFRNRNSLFKWHQENDAKERQNAFKKLKYEAECKEAEQEYLKKHAFWEKSLIEVKAVYRYFKIALFSKDAAWDGDISPKLLSTWYLTYVLFCIFADYPDELSFQMGIPESIGDSYANTQKKNAEDVFYTAYRLYKLFVTKERFLAASVEDLKSITVFDDFEIDYSQGSQVLVLPEAFAGLLTITQQGKIDIGMTLLVDIGGGSTDISLFNVISNRQGVVPNISRIISIHHGLNYIYSLYKETHYEMGMEEIRKLFVKNPSAFKEEIELFRKELTSIVKDQIYHPLVKAALKKGISEERLLPIVVDRPVIYTGGGGVFDVFHKKVFRFSEPISVSKDLLSLKNITEKRITDDELSILSVAYGLSIPQVREPVMTPLTQLFRHINIHESRAPRASGYEHGMSDVE